MSWDPAGAAVQAEGDSFASLERRKMKELQAVMQSRRVGGGPSVRGAEPLLAKPVLHAAVRRHARVAAQGAAAARGAVAGPEPGVEPAEVAGEEHETTRVAEALARQGP